MSKQVYANTLAVVGLIEQLQEGATVAEVVEATGLHVATVRRWLRHFHAAGLVYIAEYELSAGPWPSRVWRWGEGRDMKYRRQTSMERWTRHKARRQEQMVRQALGGAQ